MNYRHFAKLRKFSYLVHSQKIGTEARDKMRRDEMGLMKFTRNCSTK